MLCILKSFAKSEFLWLYCVPHIMGSLDIKFLIVVAIAMKLLKIKVN